MKPNNVSPEDREMILKALNYHFPSAKVYLFGSRALGTNKPGADIDIAVDIGSPILLREMDRARVTLDHLFIALKIDLVDINAIPHELKQVILSQGIKWTS